MKLLPLLLLISVSAFSQQKDKPVKYIDRIDSLDMDITWDEIFRSSGFDGPSRYADPELAKKFREWMQSRQCPYVWTDKNRPIAIDDELFQELTSSNNAFKKSYQRADSLMRLNQSQPSLNKKPSAMAGLISNHLKIYLLSAFIF